MDHEDFMRRAIELSREKMCAGDGGPFGAVIAQDGKIVGEGWNRVTSLNDATAHAEIVAIREACRRLGVLARGSRDVHELRAMSDVSRSHLLVAHHSAFYANTTQDAAGIGFDDEALYRELALPWQERRIVSGRLLAEEAFAVFEEWTEWPEKVPY